MSEKDLQSMRDIERIVDMKLQFLKSRQPSAIQVVYWIVMIATSGIGTYVTLTPFLGIIPITESDLPFFALVGSLVALAYGLRRKPSVINWKNVLDNLESTHVLVHVSKLFLEAPLNR